MTQPAPRSLRLHIGLFGRRNVGKSSLLNAFTRQRVSIVSDTLGTTTDPVEKPMELLPLGPVLFVDTAGIDDEGALGELRMARTRAVLDRVDLGVVVTEGGAWGPFEAGLLEELRARKVPVLVVRNKADLGEAPGHPDDLPWVSVSALEGSGMAALREALLRLAPADFFDNRRLVSDLVPPGETAVLVVPIDKEAPKGRLILPQVMAIRDLLDGESMALVVQERELRNALQRLTRPPALVVTDSQAFLKVAADVPRDVPMTSFSILMSRFQGDLAEQVRGTLGIERLKGGDRVLVAETCGHHPVGEDIGRVKIPRWLTQYVGAKLEFEHVQGRDFPEDLSPYGLVVHCGNCTGNRREMLSRIHRAREAGVPLTNYGLTIAYSLGIFDRALEPFPAAKALLEQTNAAK
ncbi:[FeFe] hydrogenase H-cluster maturation GTPase HydF [Mesoterricola sediminis]|uniref:GTP-binding protein n=1 Tax=Mesoterricola sediminis TaxID=2927980 RepID=A0AA48GTG0_9BACT|nr:[FeFe] hydrogenase H-cluster maturation GTPase HydF [Mesoterricola sediminis]BDU77409.1 GTP-binding protein [Mesoterricola sediminis]